MSVSERIEAEFNRICEEIEDEERSGAQLDLNLGTDSSMFDDEPPVEVPGVVPTVVVDEEEEDSLFEIGVSGKETKTDQAEGTGDEPVPEDAQRKQEGMVVGTGAPVPGADRSGEAPDLMEVDPAVRTGGDPVREEAAGAGPDLGSGEGDLRFEDFPGDEFERVGEFTPCLLYTSDAADE